MQSIILCIVLTITLSLQAQELSKETFDIIKNDDAKALQMQSEYNELNGCFEAGKKPYTLLALCIKANASNCFALLLTESDIDLDKACAGKTPLHYAAQYGRFDFVKELLKAGADISSQYKGRTALDYAQKMKHTEMALYLKQY
jgi:ankyrin repeat protein